MKCYNFSVRAQKASPFFLIAVSFVVSLFAAEIGLRLFFPSIESNSDDLPNESPFLYNSDIGYEFKPHSVLEQVPGLLEQRNFDGFRGPDYSPKPREIFRILALGDSLVEAARVPYQQTWEKKLEDLLNERARASGGLFRCEVINMGTGGYVSWQVLKQLQRKGLKYQPDLVLVLVGWNDLIFSTLPCWESGIDLSKLEQSYWRSKNSRSNVVRKLCSISHLFRLVRHTRNIAWNARYRRLLIRDRQNDSGFPFRQEALDDYLQQLEIIRQTLEKAYVPMGLLSWTIALNPEELSDPSVQEKLAVYHYSNFPLSTREYWIWYSRYRQAQMEFAAKHPNVAFIDVGRGFVNMPRRQRLKQFVDLVHLNAAGNQKFAELVYELLQEQSLIP